MSAHLFAWRTAKTAGFADDAELLFRKAVLHRQAGQSAEAEACWRRVLTLRRPEPLCSVDQGIYSPLTLGNLAVYREPGSFLSAEAPVVGGLPDLEESRHVQPPESGVGIRTSGLEEQHRDVGIGAQPVLRSGTLMRPHQ